MKKRVKLKLMKIGTFETNGKVCIMFKNEDGTLYYWFTRSYNEFLIDPNYEWYTVTATIDGYTERYIIIKNVRKVKDK